MPRSRGHLIYTGHLYEGKNVCEKLGVKKGGGCLLKGGVFSEFTVYIEQW